MSDRDRFAALANGWLQNEELSPPDRQFVVDYLLRYLRGQQIVINSLPDVLEWQFTGDNIVFTQIGLTIPVADIINNYIVQVGEFDQFGVTDFAWDGIYLYAVGSFQNVGSLATTYAVKLDTSTMTFSAMNGITAFGFDQLDGVTVDSNGLVYVGSNNGIRIGGTVYVFAVWDGSSWTGIEVDATYEQVAKLLAVGTDIYIVGLFGASNIGVKKYDGSFTDLDTGTDADYISTIARDSSGNIYIGGSRMTEINGVSAAGVAMYDGSWHAMGTGLGTSSETVERLFVDSQDRVWAGGGLDAVGNVAYWNGTEWRTAGGGVGNDLAFVCDFVEDSNGNIYATYAKGSSFSDGGGIKRWNGSQWATVSSSTSTVSYGLAIDARDVIYAGD